MGLAVLDGGQAVEVTLDALCELVAIRAHHLELGLPAYPVAVRPCIAPEHGRDPGPLGDHESGHGASEQCSENQAHGVILAAPDFEPLDRTKPLARSPLPIDVGERRQGKDEGMRALAAVSLGLQGDVELLGERKAR